MCLVLIFVFIGGLRFFDGCACGSTGYRSCVEIRDADADAGGSDAARGRLNAASHTDRIW